MKIVDIMRKPVIVNSCSTLEEVLKVMNAQKVNSVLAIHED
jgi:CBS domain-containing protein